MKDVRKAPAGTPELFDAMGIKAPEKEKTPVIIRMLFILGEVHAMVYVMLVIGFVLLVKGADVFVSGSSAIAKYFHIPAFIIGLTIVACGTSLPEAAISVTAAVQGANGIAVGNALGSNLFNLLVVLGGTALVKPCSVNKAVLRFEYPFSIFAAVLLAFLAGGFRSNGFVLSRADGIALLAAFVIFMAVTLKGVWGAQRNRPEAGDTGRPETAGDTGEPSQLSPAKGILYICVGIVGIILGGDFVVESATAIAEAWGIDEVLIGLTVVALGTSLPELVISVVAAVKGETDIAVGNVIGSNIFNLLLVLGLSASIHPIPMTMASFWDLAILVSASLLIFFPLVWKQELSRGWGLVLLLLYAAYLAYIILRAV